MPTPRKSLDELVRSGTYKKNPGRYSARVASVEGFTPLGPPPKHLSKPEAAAWNEIRRKAPAGTLAKADFMLVELAAKLLVKSRSDSANFTATDSRVLQSLANDLGMSPIKRGRVSPAQAPKAPSKFAALAATFRAADRVN